jgi:hypothetical protein
MIRSPHQLLSGSLTSRTGTACRFSILDSGNYCKQQQVSEQEIAGESLFRPIPYIEINAGF